MLAQVKLGGIKLGLLGFAPVYLNGLFAIFFVFVLPGVVFVRAFNIPNFPQRWFVVFLSSLTANHLLVTLLAALHFDPLETYRAAATVLIAAFIFLTIWQRAKSNPSMDRRGYSIILLSDIGWLLSSLAVLGPVYFNVWKHGVPNIFEGGDVSASWNAWSLIWSQGSFPVSSYGYPQFIPTIWAVTYIFTGSTEQYFAFYTYIVFLIAPIILNAMNLGRVSWWQPLVPGFVFVWFVAEIQESWLRHTLEQGYPDWVAAIFGFSGIVLFVTNAPKDQLDAEQITNALLSLCLLTIAAATKPLFGLFAIAAVIAICTDAAKYLHPRQRNRLVMAAVGLASAFVAAYAVNYLHLTVRSMPNYPVSELSERMLRAINLLTANFTLPFRILALVGLILSPFLPRVRWFVLPLLIGVWLWANNASYDLRNLLGLLLISAFIPVYALASALAVTKVFSCERRWNVPDVAVVFCVAALSLVLTLGLAQGDKELRQRFESEQLSKGVGLELNQKVEHLLLQGCTIFSADDYFLTISAFQLYRGQMQFFHFTEPLNDLLAKQINESTGCTSILYPPDRTHRSILAFIRATTEARGLTRVTEDNGMLLIEWNAYVSAKN